MWELGEVFRVLTERRPIVLVFDDLQWSDTATVEWLAYFARWQARPRLLILGTYRPADVIASGHPLYAIIQELRGKGQSTELRLELLNRQQVHDYCTRRFPGSALSARVITLLSTGALMAIRSSWSGCWSIWSNKESSPTRRDAGSCENQSPSLI
jgi:predicted ATPase